MTPKQCEDRRSWIGASDLARDATGLFGGCTSVLAEKIYGSDWEGSPDTELGNWVEPHLLDWAWKEIDIVCGDRQVILEHPDSTTHIRATLDQLACCDMPGSVPFRRFPVEAKYVGSQNIKEWTEDEPSAYAIVQINVQMDCLGSDHGYVVAFLHGIGKRLYKVQRDEELCAALRDRARYLWHTYIKPKRMPEVTDIVAMTEAHAIHLPKFDIVPGKAVQLGGGHQIVADLLELSSKAKGAEERFHEGLNTLMKMALGDAQTGVLPDGSTLERKEIERKGYTVEPSIYVEMRRSRRRTRKDESDGE